MTPKTTSDLPLLPIGLMPLPQRRKIDKICLFVWYIPQKTVISQSVGHRKPSQVTKIDDMDKKEQILISISGIDHPGLTAQVMEILARHEAQILDIGQADIHSTLSLGILVRINEQASGQMMKELLFKSTELRVNIDFVPISDDEYEDWVSRQGKNRYILTVIGRELSARQIALATRS